MPVTEVTMKKVEIEGRARVKEERNSKRNSQQPRRRKDADKLLILSC